MIKKRILILSRSFYPINSPRSFRTTELVKEFARRNHDVTLLTLKNKEQHLPFEKEYGVTIKNLGPLSLPNINVPPSGWLHWPKRILGRILYQFFEYPNIELMYRVRESLKSLYGFDLLISIAAPHPVHWGVSWAWNEDKPVADTWVADCGDPYMGNVLEPFNRPFYMKYFEKSFCEKADFISVPEESSIDAYYPEFHDKIRVIPQGFNFDDVNTYQGEIQREFPKFAYAGGVALAGVRDLSEILNYLINNEKEFEFHIYSRNGKEFLRKYSQKAPNKIKLQEPLDREELLYELSKMDFLINLDNDTRLSTPSKLIDYGLADRPILNISGINPDYKLIDEFLEGDYSNRFKVENIGRYNIKNVADKFLSLA